VFATTVFAVTVGSSGACGEGVCGNGVCGDGLRQRCVCGDNVDVGGNGACGDGACGDGADSQAMEWISHFQAKFKRQLREDEICIVNDSVVAMDSMYQCLKYLKMVTTNWEACYYITPHPRPHVEATANMLIERLRVCFRFHLTPRTCKRP
jgi:hypothetical protein